MKAILVLEVLSAETSSEDPLYKPLWKDTSLSEEQVEAILQKADENIDVTTSSESDYVGIELQVETPEYSSTYEIYCGDYIVIYDDGSIGAIVNVELTPEKAAVLFG